VTFDLNNSRVLLTRPSWIQNSSFSSINCKIRSVIWVSGLTSNHILPNCNVLCSPGGELDMPQLVVVRVHHFSECSACSLLRTTTTRSAANLLESLVSSKRMGSPYLVVSFYELTCHHPESSAETFFLAAKVSSPDGHSSSNSYTHPFRPHHAAAEVAALAPTPAPAHQQQHQQRQPNGHNSSTSTNGSQISTKSAKRSSRRRLEWRVRIRVSASCRSRSRFIVRMCWI
jgi:hypothetical protein